MPNPCHATGDFMLRTPFWLQRLRIVASQLCLMPWRARQVFTPPPAWKTLLMVSHGSEISEDPSEISEEPSEISEALSEISEGPSVKCLLHGTLPKNLGSLFRNLGSLF